MSAPALVARPAQRFSIVGSDGSAANVATELHIIPRGQEPHGAFLDRLCRQFFWHAGDCLTFVVRSKQIVQVRVHRDTARPLIDEWSPSYALRTAVARLVEHGYGTTTFHFNGDDILVHDVTELTIKLAPGEGEAAVIARAGCRPGDQIGIDEVQLTARVIRTALPTECLALEL